MVLSLTYSKPPRRCPPSLQESMTSLADNISKFIASQTAFTAQLKINMEKHKQTLAFISSIYQANQRETNTPTIATPHTGTQQVITPPPLNTIKPKIISKAFVTQNTSTTVDITTTIDLVTTITDIDADVTTQVPSSRLLPSIANKNHKLVNEIAT